MAAMTAIPEPEAGVPVPAFFHHNRVAEFVVQCLIFSEQIGCDRAVSWSGFRVRQVRRCLMLCCAWQSGTSPGL